MLVIKIVVLMMKPILTTSVKNVIIKLFYEVKKWENHRKYILCNILFKMYMSTQVTIRYLNILYP